MLFAVSLIALTALFLFAAIEDRVRLPWFVAVYVALVAFAVRCA
jgi:hypothetical protein